MRALTPSGTARPDIRHAQQLQQNREHANSVTSSMASPSWSWMSATVTIACNSRPRASTRIWRSLPSAFLPANTHGIDRGPPFPRSSRYGHQLQRRWGLASCEACSRHFACRWPSFSATPTFKFCIQNEIPRGSTDRQLTRAMYRTSTCSILGAYFVMPKPAIARRPE